MPAESTRKSKKVYRMTRESQLNAKENNLLELYYLTKAYNRGEIQFNEWLEKSYNWALTVLEVKEKNKIN